MNGTRVLDLFSTADETDLMIFEFDRPTGHDLDVLAFSVHCSGPVHAHPTAMAA